MSFKRRTNTNGVFMMGRPLAGRRPLLTLKSLRRHVASHGRNYGNLKSLVKGARTYTRTRETPHEAHLSLRQLHCTTGGWSSDILHWVVALRHPANRLDSASGVLGDLSKQEIEAARDQIREK